MILDVNDNSPVFNQSSSTWTINETASTGSVVGSVIATDADLGTNAAVSYSIISGDPFGQFELDAKSGSLTLRSSLRFELQSTYFLTILAQGETEY
jgi:small ligand-binding sensory domain FIST